MKRLISLVVSAVAILATGAFAQVPLGPMVRTWNTNDTSPVFRINNSGNEIVTITVSDASDSITVTNGTVGKTFSLGASTNVSVISRAVAGVTNSSGLKTLSVDYGCSLALETLTGKVAVATTTIPANKRGWVDGPKWISASNLMYRTYVPAADKGGPGNARQVKRVMADTRGTGDVTISGYADGVMVYRKYITSPVYVNGQYWFNAATSTNVSDNVGPGQVSVELNLPFGQSEGIMFEATRATTVTAGGGVGVLVDLVP